MAKFVPDPFADLYPTQDTPPDIVGGEGNDPAFQEVKGQWQPVPRATLNRLAPPKVDFGDLIPPEQRARQAQNRRPKDALDLREFADLLPKSATPESDKAAQELYDFKPGMEQVRGTHPGDLPWDILHSINQWTTKILSPAKDSGPMMSPEVAKEAAKFAIKTATGAWPTLGVFGKKGADVQSGIEQSVADFLSGSSSPESLVGVGLMSVPVIGQIAAQAYALNVLSSAPEQFGDLYQTVSKYGLLSKETAAAATKHGINDLMGFLASKSGGIRSDLWEGAARRLPGIEGRRPPPDDGGAGQSGTRSTPPTQARTETVPSEGEAGAPESTSTGVDRPLPTPRQPDQPDPTLTRPIITPQTQNAIPQNLAKEIEKGRETQNVRAAAESIYNQSLQNARGPGPRVLAAEKDIALRKNAAQTLTNDPVILKAYDEAHRLATQMAEAELGVHANESRPYRYQGDEDQFPLGSLNAPEATGGKPDATIQEVQKPSATEEVPRTAKTGIDKSSGSQGEGQGVEGGAPAGAGKKEETVTAEPAKDLTRNDKYSLGIVPKGTVETGKLIDAGARMVRDVADTVGGKVLPRLTRAGVMDEAVQHASARQYVPALVQELQSKVFPKTYKSIPDMQKTIDVIKADNILGGYDEAKIELQALRQADKPNPAKIAEQEEFIKNIEESQNLAALDEQVRSSKGTPIEEDIHRWEEHVTPLMDSLYNEIKGVDPNTPRETRGRYYGARMNLLPEIDAEKLADFADQNKPLPEVNVSNYRNPNVKRDRFMRQAKLTGRYSSDPNLVMLNSFGGRWNEVTKQRFYNALQEKGVAEIRDPGDPAVTEIGGKPAGRMAIKMPETNPETGRTSSVEKAMYVQKDLVNEIRNVLNTDGRMATHPLFQAVTQVQLLQLADATAHNKNIHSVVVNALGSTTMGKDLLRKVPGIGTASAITEISRVAREIAADTPAIRSEIAEMTKRGMIRPEYPLTGIQKITRMQQIIHDVDTASRVIMNRRFDNLVARKLAPDTIEARRNFVQQIGEYNRRLMSRFESTMRDIGFSPFIVAGRTFNRFTRRLVTGAPGFETAGSKAHYTARAAQISGLAMATTLPALINIATTGSMGGRKGTPIGTIDFGPNFDTNDGRRRQLDVFQLVGIRRGLRGMGIEAAIEGFRNGQTPNEIVGKAWEGVTQTAMHPYIGPGLGGIYQTLTGKRLDLRSGWKVDVPEARDIGGIAQVAENFRIALKTQNPFLYGVSQIPIESMMENVFGVPPDPKDQTPSGQTVTGLVKAPFSAVGYRESKTPSSMVYDMVADWKKAEGLPPTPPGTITSKYQLLRNAIETGDDDKAQAEYDKLIAEGMKPYDIKSGFKKSVLHPFTGKESDDKKFKATLDDEQLAIYEEAVQKRQETLSKFRDFYQR